MASNPVSQALSRLVELMEVEGLENETRELEGFYESVRRRAQALDNAEARQKVLLELYERFFQVALKKEAERLGIVYTPIEVVDFILHSADHALHQHFGRRLTDENVHILDPFTGTGTFIVRLLQNLGTDPGRGQGSQIPVGAARQRDRAAGLLHRRHQHRGVLPRTAGYGHRICALRRYRFHRHLYIG